MDLVSEFTEKRGAASEGMALDLTAHNDRSSGAPISKQTGALRLFIVYLCALLLYKPLLVSRTAK